MVWLDAGNHALAPLSPVTVRLEGAETEGTVFITPEGLLSTPPRIDGLVIASQPPPQPDPACSHLPGSEFPALGETVQHGDVQGTVISLDPAERRVTISPENDGPIVVSWDSSANG